MAEHGRMTLSRTKVPMPDQALVFEDAASSPGTHVLVVGIGTYPYLEGGTHHNPQVSGGMGQLTAPQGSAVAVADWFLDHFSNPEKPLCSLAMVVSAPDPFVYHHAKANVAPGHALPQGEIGQIEAAIQAWAQRCENPDSQAVFFFSGHGAVSGESLLLARDFGAKPLQLFSGSLNLSAFEVAMNTRSPNFQLFLVDACQVPRPVATSAINKTVMGSGGIGAAMPHEAARNGGAAKQSIHLSTTQYAFAEIDGHSLFTDALLQALSGGGAHPRSAGWVVPGSLQLALDAYLERLGRRHNVQQDPQLYKAANFKIHKPDEVKVPVYVTCDPAQALRQAHIKVRRQGVEHGAFNGPVAQQDEWMLLLPTKAHEVEAVFPNTTYPTYKEETQVTTPETLVHIECQGQP